MTPPGLYSSTPFRLTLRLVAIFAAAMLASFAVAFLVIRSYLDGDLHNELVQELTAWQTTAEAIDVEGRLADVIGSTPPRAELMVLVTRDGRRIGNVPDFGPVDGFRVVRDKDIKLDKRKLAESYLVSSAEVGGGKLILGRNREKISDLGEFFFLVFLFAVLPTLALASALGFATSLGTRRRVEEIRAALDRLTNGRLDARVAGIEGETDDLAQIGKAVNRMAEAQSASMASLQQVSADIAHDLKTPIQRVSVLLDVLESAGPLNVAQDAALTSARDETRQIVLTFQSLLQIAQLEGGAARTHFGPVDLGRVVAGIADVYAPSADESGHRLEWSVPDAPVMVAGDRNLLGQIAANLIENGLRHTPEGSRITLRVGPDRVLTVEDNGPGIPAAERDNVLRRLYRLERSRTTEGSGLGLSLASAIAELHGATFELGDAGPGLRVTLRFPPV